MEAVESQIKESVLTLNADKIATKRKFTPNIIKGLAKKSKPYIEKASNNPVKNNDSTAQPIGLNKKCSNKRGEDNGPKYVQGYSIFEQGVGCFVKAEKASVDLRTISTLNTERRSDTTFISTEVKHDPILQIETFVKDVKQCFKDSPASILDAVGVVTPPRGDEVPDSSQRSLQLTSQLFDETSTSGSLFSLQLPENLFSAEPPVLKEGRFGKIQLLDNGEVRLLISGASFRLVCPRPTTCATDVVSINEEEDGGVSMASLGPIDQFVTAVPDFARFARLGR